MQGLYLEPTSKMFLAQNSFFETGSIKKNG